MKYITSPPTNILYIVDNGSKVRAVTSSPVSDRMDKVSANVNVNRGFRDGVASEGTPYRIAVGTLSESESLPSSPSLSSGSFSLLHISHLNTV